MNTKELKYIEFLKSKIEIAPENGFDIELDNINPICKPHQKDVIKWAVKGGRRALFESFGLGKTIQQLEILRLILKREGGKALVICPLGVRQEFKHDAEVLLKMPVEYIRTQEDIDNSTADILICNYEPVRDGKINPKQFTAVSLDEASVLRSYGSKTYQTFLRLFKGVKYKFVCTATPCPNKFKELIHYGGYLEVMDTGQALTRFFQRDSTQANNLTLYPHKEKEFWLWMSTWAVFITKPSDLGYSDEGYDLPEMEVRYHKVEVDHSTAGAEKDGQVKMFRDAALGLKDASKEKRDSIKTRVNKMVQILESDPENHFILWHDQEAERHTIKTAWPQALEVYGSQDMDLREKRVTDFSQGGFKYLATKPILSGSGSNFQRFCHRSIFVGIGYKFNDFIQAIHRIQRFLQTHKVVIDVIYTESEQTILDTLLKKWTQHKQLQIEMTNIIKEYGLSSTDIMDKLARTIGCVRKVVKGKKYKIVLNDTVLENMEMESNSLDMLLTSIPFSNHYEYTPSYNDLGHNENNDRFFEQMDYLTPELLRCLKPGRVYACHVKDRVLFGNTTGYGMPSMDPFHVHTILHYQKHGFIYFGMITVITDVVRENNQTYRLGWTENSKDGTKMGVGCPEYILLFRKLPTDTTRAYADDPVVKPKSIYSRGKWQIDAHSFWRSSGDRLLSSDDFKDIPISEMQALYRKWSQKNIYDHNKHVELAESLEDKDSLPASFMVIAPGSWNNDVWDNVNRMLTLNTEQTQKQKQNHICPLQFDTVDRLIERYSNEGDLIHDPFGGIMTVPYRAIKKGRRGSAVELNSEYFHDGIPYLKAIELEVAAPTLFDLEGIA